MAFLFRRDVDSRQTAGMRAYRRMVLVGAAIWLVAIVILVRMDHPWEGQTGKRLLRGQDLIPEDYLRIFGLWAGIGNAILWGALLLTSPWWWKWAGGVSGDPRARVGASPGRGAWLALLAILLTAAAIRAPQLDRYILRDEQDSLRWTIHGYLEYSAKEKAPEFHRVTWMDTFWGNQKGNNPIPLSVTAKASLAAWRGLSGAGEQTFSRVALRIPTYLTGLLSIAALWWWLHLLGFSRAAWVGALIAALHPLHTEYGIEARGYSLVLLATVLAMSFSLLALRRRSWRFWAGLGLSLLLMAYAFVGSFYFVISLSVGLAALMGWRWLKQGDQEARENLARFTVTGLVTFGVYLQLALPALVQLVQNQDIPQWSTPLDLGWVFSTYTEFATGANFLDDVNAIRELPSVHEGLSRFFTDFVPREPIYFLLTFVAIPFLSLLGAKRWWRTASIGGRLLLVSSMAAPLLMYLYDLVFGHLVLFFFYLIFALPVVIGLLALGLESLPEWLPSAERNRAGVLLAVTVLFAGWYVWQTGPWKPYRSPQLTAPGEPYVFYTRGSANWVVYPEGITAKFPANMEIPESFPWSLPVEKIVSGVNHIQPAPTFSRYGGVKPKNG